MWLRALRPLPRRLGERTDLTRRPVGHRGGLLGVQGARQPAVGIASTILINPATPAAARVWFRLDLPVWLRALRPLPRRLGERTDLTRRPVGHRGGLLGVQGARQPAVGIASTILINPATPAAARVWFRLDLTEPSRSGCPSGRSWP
ncbi:hypothetical protein A6A07_28750 [Streptomyces sp. CB03911]|nr:hypothetical protein A6A07_28750 [Streptomyces sp. CB03911]